MHAHNVLEPTEDAVPVSIHRPGKQKGADASFSVNCGRLPGINTPSHHILH